MVHPFASIASHDLGSTPMVRIGPSSLVFITFQRFVGFTRSSIAPAPFLDGSVCWRFPDPSLCFPAKLPPAKTIGWRITSLEGTPLAISLPQLFLQVKYNGASSGAPRLKFSLTNLLFRFGLNKSSICPQHPMLT